MEWSTAWQVALIITTFWYLHRYVLQGLVLGQLLASKHFLIQLVLFGCYFSIWFIGFLNFGRADGNLWLTMIFILVITALVLSIDFIIFPILLLIFYGNETSAKIAVPADRKSEVKLRVVSMDAYNAFAVGALPFLGLVVFTKKIIESLNKESLEAILWHELGHIRSKHIAKMYFIQWMIFTAIWTLIVLAGHMGYLQYKSLAADFPFMVGLATINMILIWYVPKYFIRKHEYEADRFAADELGADRVISALESLDLASGGLVSRGNATHPTLQERIDSLNGTA